MAKRKPTGNAIRRGKCGECVEYTQDPCGIRSCEVLESSGYNPSVNPEGVCVLVRSRFRSREKQRYMVLSITLRITEINEQLRMIDGCDDDEGDKKARSSLRKKLVKKRMKYARNSANRKMGAK